MISIDLKKCSFVPEIVRILKTDRFYKEIQYRMISIDLEKMARFVRLQEFTPTSRAGSTMLQVKPKCRTWYKGRSNVKVFKWRGNVFWNVEIRRNLQTRTQMSHRGPIPPYQ